MTKRQQHHHQHQHHHHQHQQQGKDEEKQTTAQQHHVVKNRYKKRRTDASAARMAAPPAKTTSPELELILGKLRPFQREAFDYAVHGKRPPDRGSNAKGKPSSTVENENLTTAFREATTNKPVGGGTGRLLLADEMGLGKTVTSLAIMTAYKDEWPLLIICPASLRYQWPSEIEKFLPWLPSRAIHVIGGLQDVSFVSRRRDIQIVVATYSQFQNRSPAATALCSPLSFACVICDESHNLRDRHSQKTKLLLPLLQRARRLVLLSGTPALARPVELWPQLVSLNATLFGTYSDYTKRYCNAHCQWVGRGRVLRNVKGLSHEQELYAKVSQVMIRRQKSQVLAELPAKQRSLLFVSLTDPAVRAQCRHAMQQLQSQDKRRRGGEDAGESVVCQQMEERQPLVMAAYQQSGIAKAQPAAEYILDWLAGTEPAACGKDASSPQKLVVFAHHQVVLDTLETALSKALRGVGHIRIDGSVSPADRARRVADFQTRPQVRVALLSVTAAGVGLTLTAASSVLFAELHWTPGVLAQAEDRCHRMGQRQAVQVTYLVLQDRNLSIDTCLWTMLSKKQNTLGKILQGQEHSKFHAEKAVHAERASAQDEIVAFFAQSSKEGTTLPKSPPVKGSITSFFSPQSHKTPPPLKTGATGDRHGPDKPLPLASGQKRRREAAAEKEIIILDNDDSGEPPTKPSYCPEDFLWTCPRCTCENSLAWEVCEACGHEMASATGESQSMQEPEEDIVCWDGTKRAQLSSTVSVDRPTISPSSSDAVVNLLHDMEHDNVCANDNAIRSHHTNASAKESSGGGGGARCDEERKDDLLSFQVSQNSGRIALHLASTSESLLVNFDVAQVQRTPSTDERRAEVQGRTKRMPRAGAHRDFCNNVDPSKVKAVVETVDRDVLCRAHLDFDLERFCQETMQFLAAYLPLREVEKKLLGESDRFVTAGNLRWTVVELLGAVDTTPTTERYVGGAKERALQSVKDGVATTQDMAVLNGDMCAWCGGALPNVSSRGSCLAAASSQEGLTYCSPKCTEDGRLRRGGMFASTRIRAQVFALERGVCRRCGVDAHALYLRIHALPPAERFNALLNAHWRLPQKSLDRLLQKPVEADFWQADHIRPVAEGGGGCGLENLQTLCTPCHAQETEKLRWRLRGASPGSGQMDIRNAFPKCHTV